jgi:hypothetical protein
MENNLGIATVWLDLAVLASLPGRFIPPSTRSSIRSSPTRRRGNETIPRRLVSAAQPRRGYSPITEDLF